MFTWRWGRAIENYLLPVTAPAALYLQGAEDAAGQLTAEVFAAVARHFFPVVSESESQKGKLCGHPVLKWNDLVGTGWKAASSQKKWASLLQSADVRVHLDPDCKSAAESLRNFSIDVLGVAALLVHKHDHVYGSGGSCADEWLLHLAAVRGDVRQGKYDALSAKGSVVKVDWSSACAAILAGPAAKPKLPLNRGDADDAALWFHLPAVCSFAANLCSCEWLGDILGNQSDAARVKQAAASVLCLLQHALCVLLIGCDPALPAPQSTLFSSSDCPCFLPLVCSEGKAGDKQKRAGRCAVVRCFNCSREGALHALRPRNPAAAAPSDFLVELCRVGSVGWESHGFMHAVYGRTHLGVEFNASRIEQSHSLYEQHVGALLGCATVSGERYLEMTAHEVPDVAVYVIPEGKTKDGIMLPLLQQRRAEFERLCNHIELLVEGPASLPCTPTTPATPAAAACTTPTAARAAHGAAAVPPFGSQPAEASSPKVAAAPPKVSFATSASDASRLATPCIDLPHADDAAASLSPRTEPPVSSAVMNGATASARWTLEASSESPGLVKACVESAVSAAPSGSSSPRNIVAGFAAATFLLCVVVLLKSRSH